MRCVHAKSNLCPVRTIKCSGNWLVFRSFSRKLMASRTKSRMRHSLCLVCSTWQNVRQVLIVCSTVLLPLQYTGNTRTCTYALRTTINLPLRSSPRQRKEVRKLDLKRCQIGQVRREKTASASVVRSYNPPLIGWAF